MKINGKPLEQLDSIELDRWDVERLALMVGELAARGDKSDKSGWRNKTRAEGYAQDWRRILERHGARCV